jgi:hypothetical protein
VLHQVAREAEGRAEAVTSLVVVDTHLATTSATAWLQVDCAATTLRHLSALAEGLGGPHHSVSTADKPERSS